MAVSSKQVEDKINEIAAFVVRHWLFFANLLIFIYGSLPWLSAVANAMGWTVVGNGLFWVYRTLCHQDPDRSFFILGYQVAYCHRCAALYTSAFVSGLLYALFRRQVRPAPMIVGALLALPIAIDGGRHLIEDIFGLQSADNAIGSTNFILRMVTGALCGLILFFIVYPRVDNGFKSVKIVSTPVDA
jgi:uncharacterized membrane protein